MVVFGEGVVDWCPYLLKDSLKRRIFKYLIISIIIIISKLLFQHAVMDFKWVLPLRRKNCFKGFFPSR